LLHLRSHVLDGAGISAAICNCLYGVQLLFSEDMAAAIARAMNKWMARELLDGEPRLRASIVVPMRNAELGGALRYDTRQSPAGNRQIAIVGPGGGDEPPRSARSRRTVFRG
jgi:hypothetical protein